MKFGHSCVHLIFFTNEELIKAWTLLDRGLSLLGSCGSPKSDVISKLHDYKTLGLTWDGTMEKNVIS